MQCSWSIPARLLGAQPGTNPASILLQIAEDVRPVGVTVRNLVPPEVELLQAVQGGEVARLGELRAEEEWKREGPLNR